MVVDVSGQAVHDGESDLACRKGAVELLRVSLHDIDLDVGVGAAEFEHAVVVGVIVFEKFVVLFVDRVHIDCHQSVVEGVYFALLSLNSRFGRVERIVGRYYSVHIEYSYEYYYRQYDEHHFIFISQCHTNAPQFTLNVKENAIPYSAPTSAGKPG